MSETERLLAEENKEKKRLGYSARAKRGGGGHRTRCTLPHERLTQKQLKEMNGPVIQINLNDKLSYSEYKAIPTSMKKEYLEHLRDKYGARIMDIAQMMEITRNALICYNDRQGIKVTFPRGAKQSVEWKKFISEETLEEPKQQEAPITQEEKRSEKFCGIEQGVISMKGTGADLINCILKVLGSNTDKYEAQFRFSKISS